MDNDKVQEIYTALRDYMRASVQVGRGVVDEIHIEEIASHHTFFLELDTLFEHRRYRYHYRNWKGENLPASKPEQGDIWDTSVPVPKLFRNKEIDISLPHLDWLIDCGGCEGHGTIPCISCSGKGYHDQIGRLCNSCFGSGKKMCEACQRTKKRIEGKSIDITYEAHKLTRGIGRGELSKKQLGQVKVPPILHLQGTPIELPTTGDGYRQAHILGDPAIEKAIRSMLKKSMPASDVRIAAQQLTVRRIPVVVADYHWSKERGRLWLLGGPGSYHVVAPSPPFGMDRGKRLASEVRSFFKRWS